MKKILISGGTGLVGRSLQKVLSGNGYEVNILSRSKSNKSSHTFYWNPEENYIDEEALNDVNIIIHLAGSSIAGKRWTAKYKKEILDSRVKSSELLLKKCREKNIVLENYISSSAVGYYGSSSSDKIYKEDDKAGDDFLANVCVKWEGIIDEYSDVYQNKLIFRTGVVLSDNGGALTKVLSLYKLGLGSPLGDGKQYMPWIHIDDLVSMLHFIIENKLSGIYNAVAPQHITNAMYSKEIAKQLKRPHFFPKVPEFILKLILSEMSVILLQGSKVSSKKISDAGFKFQFPNLESALKDLLL